MSSSRDRLDMENDVKRASQLTFGNKHGGIYLTRKALAWLGVVFVASIIAVALLVHFLGPCPASKESSEVYIGPSTAIPVPSTLRPKVDMRLPRSVKPLHYKLQLQPFLAENNFTFNGHVELLLHSEKAVNEITLHSLNLTVNRESVKLTANSDDTNVHVTNMREDSVRQFLVFELGNPLKKGTNYTLIMDFVGILADNLAGFYRSKYGENKWMATTQFQATDARRAFPCFDEPGFKATFDLTLIREPHMMTLSNMPLAEDTGDVTDDGWVKDHYMTTPKMSTYLLAFVVSEFANKSDNREKSDILFSVYSRKEAINQSDFALETGPLILNHFVDFFNVSYPLPKQDMVAIPDFAAGAMENWGLITYRETSLLFDPKISSTKNRQRVAIVISHELAHQWFGNLVTPAWWEDLWLNEGFASYVEYIGVNHVHSEWKMMEQFLTEELHVVFDMDSLKSSHPVSVPVDNPDEINEIFDHISYAKGASILRMMHNFLGDDVFKSGVTNYLKDKKYDNAVQDDLWEHLTKAAHAAGQTKINVKTIMDTWTVQTGYPVVTVKRNSDQSLEFSQRRFLLNPGNSSDDSSMWEIPITFTSKSHKDFENKSPKKWMNKGTKSLTLQSTDGIPPPNEWFIVNVQQTGYYRVNYDHSNWQLITDQLLSNPLEINTLNRAQILNDALTLARANELDYAIALNATKYLTKEKDYVPWYTALTSLYYVDIMLSRTAIYGKWRKYLAAQVKTLYDNVGFDDDDEGNYTDSLHILRLKRTLAIQYACDLKIQDCIDKSVTAFNNWKNNNDRIPPDAKSTIICTALKKANYEDWEFVWNKYLESNVATEKIMYLKALGCSEEPWILSKLLEMSMTSPSIRLQDISTVIDSIANNEVGRFLAYNFVRNRWGDLREKFSASAFTLSKLLKSALSDLNTPFELQELHNFASINEGGMASAERTLKQIIEETETNIQWMKANYKTIEQWLSKT